MGRKSLHPNQRKSVDFRVRLRPGSAARMQELTGNYNPRENMLRLAVIGARVLEAKRALRPKS